MHIDGQLRRHITIHRGTTQQIRQLLNRLFMYDEI